MVQLESIIFFLCILATGFISGMDDEKKKLSDFRTPCSESKMAHESRKKLEKDTKALFGGTELVVDQGQYTKEDIQRLKELGIVRVNSKGQIVYNV